MTSFLLGSAILMVEGAYMPSPNKEVNPQLVLPNKKI